MEDQKEDLSPKELRKQKKQQMWDEGMDLMFGKDRHKYAGNIWGWRFSIISLIGLIIVLIIMAIGIATGNINLEKQMDEAREHRIMKR